MTHEQEIEEKENRRADMLADAMMNGHRPHRPQAMGDNFYGQEAMEVTRDNFAAVEASNHQYDDQYGEQET